MDALATKRVIDMIQRIETGILGHRSSASRNHLIPDESGRWFSLNEAMIRIAIGFFPKLADLSVASTLVGRIGSILRFG